MYSFKGGGDLSPKKELQIEGHWATLRDDKGRIVQKVLHKGNMNESWRSVLKRLTNGGVTPIANIAKIAAGESFSFKLDDGSYSEPQVPTIKMMLAANMFLHEQLYGKAVAQTEIVKAEEETEVQNKIKALSNEELKKQLRAKLQELERKAINPGPEEDAEVDPGTED